jgi:hypothetical protein
MPANYVLLEKAVVGAAGAASVTFNSIPQTGYTDLVLKASPRGTVAEDSMNIRFNSDTGSNYPYRGFVGQGSSVSSFNGTNTSIGLGRQAQSTNTANTFGSAEFYITNYTSANYKSVSADAAEENNNSVARQQFAGAVWNSTAAITTISVFPGSGSFAQYSTFSLYGVAKYAVTPVIAPFATGGDVIQSDGTYWYHAFLASGTFTPLKALSCDVLVVAGGGSGGSNANSNTGGGGGGAGGVLAFTGQSLASGTGYTATVGGGGAASGTNTIGTVGSDSQFSSLTLVKGGGYGGSPSSGAGIGGVGGSGGGAGTNFGSSAAGGSATSGQGFAGGVSYTNNYAGGGGGSGAVGGAGIVSASGAGGAGLNTWSTWLSPTGLGVSGFIAGGGGGGAGGAITGFFGTAGSGGGGRGATGGTASDAGTANTGGGGGGNGYSSTYGGAFASGAGGSGLVIIRYPM